MAYLTMTVALVWGLGWVGAAVASVASTAFGFTLAYTLLNRVAPVTFPHRSVARQVAAALAMGGCLIALDWLLWTTGLLAHPVLSLGVLIPAGVVAYVAILLAISPEFRAIVRRTLPADAPLVG